LAKAALVSAVPPLMLKTAANPGGLAVEVFDSLRDGFELLSRAVWQRLHLARRQ
jgi:hypothetical protein